MKRYACFLLLAIAAPAVAGQRPDFTAMRQREGDDLALILGLSAAQRPALAAFLAADAPPPPPPQPPMMRPDAGQGFEQQLAERERRIGERTADDRTRLAAMRAFYAALDTRQRPVFEAVMRLRHGPGGPGPHGPPDGPPHGQGPDRN